MLRPTLLNTVSTPSVRLKLMFDDPTAVGVPDTMPAELNDRPDGRLPDEVHVVPPPEYPSALNEYRVRRADKRVRHLALFARQRCDSQRRGLIGCSRRRCWLSA